MKYLYIICLLCFMHNQAFTQKKAYQIYDKNTKSSNYEALLKEALNADIVLFGELHNNPICHWLQLELLKDLYQTKLSHLIIGAEMFEADNQIIIDEYLSKIITSKHLENEAKVWNNYATDYKPLLDFALLHKLSFIATNVPRRYASYVAKNGLESLQQNISKAAKKYISPLPIPLDLTLKGYADMIKMMQGGHGHSMSPINFASAQAIKDATMAHFILKNWRKGKLFLHFNGTYHSNNFEGIYWYLKKQNSNLKILTISSFEQKNISNLNLKYQAENNADFMIVIPENMTKTY